MPAMYVQKRDGRSERVQYDKISARIEKLAYGLNTEFVDPAYITQKVIKGVYSGVTTVQLDTLAAETAAYLTTEHPDYSTLAARIAVSNLHKQTEKCFSKVMHELYHCVDKSSGRHAPLLADDVYQIITKNKEELDSAIIYDRDYSYDYFGFKVRRRTPARARSPSLTHMQGVSPAPGAESSCAGPDAWRACLCRRSSARTCSRSTASLRSARSTCSCACRSASTRVTSPRPSRPTTTCRRSTSRMPGDMPRSCAVALCAVPLRRHVGRS